MVFDIVVASMEYSPKCYSDFKNCHFTFNQRFTPMLYDTTPNQVYAGQQIVFMLNPVSIFSKLPKNYEPFYYLKIGKELTDWEGLIDSKTRLNDNVI